MRADEPDTAFDAIIVGGSYAGLSAAMLLGRARRRVLVIDAGVRRNRFATAAHGFLGHDGRAPDLIANDARAEVLAYPSVQWRSGTALRAQGNVDRFRVEDDAGRTWVGRRLILANGVTDELPAIDGLQERWGRSVFHCPYCHGYELERGRIGVIATGEASMHQALMLPDWGTVTLLTDRAFTPDAEQRGALAARAVAVDTTAIERVTEVATVAFVDGRSVAFDGLFVATRTQVASPLARQLGCAFESGPMGEFIHTDAAKATSVAGVFACGDAARGAHSVAFAVGDGAQAGVSAHRALLFG